MISWEIDQQILIYKLQRIWGDIRVLRRKETLNSVYESEKSDKFQFSIHVNTILAQNLSHKYSLSTDLYY